MRPCFKKTNNRRKKKRKKEEEGEGERKERIGRVKLHESAKFSPRGTCYLCAKKPSKRLCRSGVSSGLLIQISEQSPWYPKGWIPERARSLSMFQKGAKKLKI